ncbi:MAG: hypothetical protein JNL67_22600 [Planctomycetaceae bacterium]|nr:hypothetical protein [Planctomycetaceae bacterium]
MKIKTREVFPFLFILVTALILGGIAQFAVGPTSFDSLSGDQGDYQRLAVNFRSTGAFGEPGQLAYRAPLYPIILGNVYSRLGTSIVVARAVNWFLAGLMATVAAMLAYNLSHSLKAAWLAAAFVCLNSYWWLLQTELMPENLAAVLLGLAVWCWPSFSGRSRGVGRRIEKHGAWAAASGLCFGLSLLCKPTFLPALVLLPLLAALLSSSSQRQSQVVFALIVLLVAAVPLGGWTYRNYRVLDAWVPLTTGSGEVFWGAHAPETIANAKGSWTNQELPAEFQARIDAEEEIGREIISSKVRWEAGWASLRVASLTDCVWHFVLKPLRLWSPSVYFDATGLWWGLKLPLLLVNSIVLGTFFYQLRRNYIVRPMVLALVIGLTLSALIFWGTIRFQYVMLPIIASIAAQAYYHYLPDLAIFKISRRKRKREEKFRQVKFE